MFEGEKKRLIEEGHTEECASYWHDVLVMDQIGERWDTWVPPKCDACDKRRLGRGKSVN